MIGYRLDGFKPALQPRSQADLGKGSHSAFQRLVGLVIRSVQPAYERMDSVQAGSARGVCMLAAGMASTLPVTGRAGGGWSAVGIDTPCPPPLTIGGGDPPEIFPTFLPTGVCPFSNLNDN